MKIISSRQNPATLSMGRKQNLIKNIPSDVLLSREALYKQIFKYERSIQTKLYTHTYTDYTVQYIQSTYFIQLGDGVGWGCWR